MINKESDRNTGLKYGYRNVGKLERPDSTLAQAIILQALEDALAGSREAMTFFREADFLYWSRIAGVGLKDRARLAVLANGKPEIQAHREVVL